MQKTIQKTLVIISSQFLLDFNSSQSPHKKINLNVVKTTVCMRFLIQRHNADYLMNLIIIRTISKFGVNTAFSPIYPPQINLYFFYFYFLPLVVLECFVNDLLKMFVFHKLFQALSNFHIFHLFQIVNSSFNI